MSRMTDLFELSYVAIFIRDFLKNSKKKRH